MSLLVSSTASCAMAVNSCDSVDTVCLDYLDDDKYLVDEHGQPAVAVAATPTASRQRASSKRKRAAADASASVPAVTPAVRTLQQAAPAAHTSAPTGCRGTAAATGSGRQSFVTLPTRNQLLPLGQARQSTSKRQSDHDLRRHRLQAAQSDWESGQEYEIGFKKSENWMPN
ncbi:hypothetical protein BC831DRAFT_40768 [Entophlyctis helioformis]|nr:hypothetical protein BC831DRAFT_40768 [Entophlyctis helioformis]